MFLLPTVNDQGSFLLQDRSALRLVTALLADELDDRTDDFRGVLETDPVLALWAVNEASLVDGTKLRTLHQASKWLDDRFLVSVTESPFAIACNESKASQVAWCSINRTSVSTARHAKQLASNYHAAPDEAFWFALLCSCKLQVDSLAKMNGRSPLHGFTWTCPKWLQKLESSLQKCTDCRDPRFAAQQAITRTSSTDKRWLDDDEACELTCSQPDAVRLIPGVLKNLQRVKQLETSFSETLHQEKMAAMQQLAYGASHEINNPLANISTRAQSLMRNEHDAERRGKLSAINDQAFRAYEMIADLMLFAKPPKLQIESVHVNQLLHRIRDEFESSMVDGQLCIQATDSQLFVPGDEVHLAEAIKAVCRNGFEAMGNQGVLMVKLSKHSGSAERSTVEISVQDSGTGLSELARRHLFDPFFSGREAGRGMGFGLSKAWRIIQEHHGRIVVTSNPLGQGSCFTINLPIENAAVR